jgi:hypothetical protein
VKVKGYIKSGCLDERMTDTAGTRFGKSVNFIKVLSHTFSIELAKGFQRGPDATRPAPQHGAI